MVTACKASRKEQTIHLQRVHRSEGLDNVWKSIEITGKDEYGNKLWEEVQEALNKDCRDLFLTKTEGKRNTAKYLLFDQC